MSARTAEQRKREGRTRPGGTAGWGSRPWGTWACAPAPPARRSGRRRGRNRKASQAAQATPRASAPERKRSPRLSEKCRVASRCKAANREQRLRSAAQAASARVCGRLRSFGALRGRTSVNGYAQKSHMTSTGARSAHMGVPGSGCSGRLRRAAAEPPFCVAMLPCGSARARSCRVGARTRRWSARCACVPAHGTREGGARVVILAGPSTKNERTRERRRERAVMSVCVCLRYSSSRAAARPSRARRAMRKSTAA